MHPSGLATGDVSSPTRSQAHHSQLIASFAIIGLTLVGINAFYITCLIIITIIAYLMGTVRRALIVQGTGIALLLSILNLTKHPSSDLVRYIEFFYLVKSNGLITSLTSHFITIRPTEFIFTCYVWLLSLLFDNAAIFVFMSTFLIYWLVFYGLFILINKNPLFVHIFAHSVRERLLIIISVSIIGFVFITFSLSGHLIRQYLALSLFFLGICYYHANNPIRAKFLLICSCFIHNSIILLLVLYFASSVLNIILTRFKSFTQFLIIFIFLALIVTGCSYFTHYIKVSMAARAITNDGTIPISLMLIDGTLILSFATLLYKQKLRLHLKGFLLFILIYVTFMLSMYEIPLITLRYYFAMDFLRGFMFIFLVFSTPKRWVKAVISTFSIIFIISPLLIFGVRYGKSPWHYAQSIFELPTANIADISDAILKVYY